MVPATRLFAIGWGDSLHPYSSHPQGMNRDHLKCALHLRHELRVQPVQSELKERIPELSYASIEILVSGIYVTQLKT